LQLRYLCGARAGGVEAWPWSPRLRRTPDDATIDKGCTCFGEQVFDRLGCAGSNGITVDKKQRGTSGAQSRCNPLRQRVSPVRGKNREERLSLTHQGLIVVSTVDQIL
jgi:hypothetical protein